MPFSAITEMQKKKSYRSVYKRGAERYCCQSTPIYVGVFLISHSAFGHWLSEFWKFHFVSTAHEFAKRIERYDEYN